MRSIFRAQSMSGRNVLSNGWEATHFPHEVIVGVVVVDRGHLAHDRYTLAWLCPEFAHYLRRQPEDVTRLHAMALAVERDLHLGLRKRAVRCSIIHFDQQGSPGSTDDVLRLEGVTVHRRVLILADDQDFFGVFLSCVRLEPVMAVAHSKHDQPNTFEIPGTEICDIPTQFALADLIALGALGIPFSGGPVGEAR